MDVSDMASRKLGSLTSQCFSNTNISILSLTASGVGSIIYDNGGHDFDAKITMNVTQTQFESLMTQSKNIANNYSYDFNCTDYGLNLFNSVRPEQSKLIVLDWIGQYLGSNYGRTPNGLYNLLVQKKALGDPNITVENGIAPAITSPCN